MAAAGLALLLDGLVRAVETGLARRRRGRLLTALGVVIALYAYAGVTLAAPWFGGRERPIVVGAKTFTEQYILSSVLEHWIERHTGRPATLVQSLGSIVAFDALAAGEIDIYVDYTGTIWANEMGRGDESAARDDIHDAVRRFLATRHNVSLAATLGFENAYALAVRAADAERLGLAAVSDLVAHAPRLVIGADYEFFARPEWASIRTAYALEFADRRTMDPTLMYQAAATGAVDVISAFSSDGRISAYDLRVLDDDRGAIPPYDAIVLAGARLAREAPDVLDALARLDGVIDADRMRQMNHRVDEDGEAPATVAAMFVESLARDLVPR